MMHESPPQPLSQLPKQDVRILLFDIDDTFTFNAKIHSIALNALERWHQTGRIAVAVTGRPAGWCDHIARMWPVDGVIGENGAFWFRYKANIQRMERQMVGQPIPDAQLRQKMNEIGKSIVSEFPKTKISSDQPYRLYDLAVDFAEDVSGIDLSQAHQIAFRLESFGMTAKVSSIHVNAWFGQHNKSTTVRQYLSECLDLDLQQQNQSAVFIGDSPNDEPMFKSLPLSVGVANLAPHLPDMQHLPSYMTEQKEAMGFVELVNHLLG